ncbi:HpyAIV family type II restriction enzyme [Mycoplasma tauri]|uniref:HpyAIV family type II restriction enzyme n=1 Tax=Mycoplasma tauri TaxID=547987 RepID=UPI001CBEE6B8|nr:hypothetical protein [Mycoplasma tauri]MBZ4226614.1 hypothetical protein [Mycoplasma tauri]
MEYEKFENELKMVLLSNNAKKLIYKLIDSPYRFSSNLHPFDFKVKFEQAFLRSQENKYYKFITQCAANMIASYGNKIIESKIVINRTIPNSENEEYEILKANFTHVFVDDVNMKIIAITQKKIDIYSSNEALKNWEKFKESLSIISEAYSNYKIDGYLWFIDPEFRKNESFYHQNSVIQESDKYHYCARYGSELFSIFNSREDWNEMELHIEKFKRQQHKYFLNIPDLNTDPEALEALVELSESNWEKLNSPLPTYMFIRRSIFDESDPNSNLFKAIKYRQIKLVSNDEDELKLGIMRYENETKE